MSQNKKEHRIQNKKRLALAGYIGVAVALALIGILGVSVWLVNVGANKTVLTVGEREVKKDLYTCVYYYESVASKDWSQYGFDTKINPYEQPLEYSFSNRQYDSWGEFFEEQTTDTLRFVLVVNDIAEKKGYRFKEDCQAQVEATLAGIESEKATAEPFEKYMLLNYGADIKKKTLKNYLTLYYRARSFYEDVTGDKEKFEQYFGADDNKLEEVYQANKEQIDVVSYRYYYLEKTKTNTAKIEALKTAPSEKAFQELCNTYENNEEYTKLDSSLMQNRPVKRIRESSNSTIAEKVTSAACKEGDIYFDDGKIDGKTVTEVVFVVSPPGKNTQARENADMQMWELDAMGVFLEQYTTENYPVEVSKSGLAAFKDSIRV